MPFNVPAILKPILNEDPKNFPSDNIPLHNGPPILFHCFVNQLFYGFIVDKTILSIYCFNLFDFSLSLLERLLIIYIFVTMFLS